MTIPTRTYTNSAGAELSLPDLGEQFSWVITAEDSEKQDDKHLVLFLKEKTNKPSPLSLVQRQKVSTEKTVGASDLDFVSIVTDEQVEKAALAIATRYLHEQKNVPSKLIGRFQ